MAAMILGAIRLRNKEALEDARARRDDQDFALRSAAQRASQDHAHQSLEMQREAQNRLGQKETFDQQERSRTAAEKAKASFLGNEERYLGSKIEGVPEAVGPIYDRTKAFVESSPEMLDPRHPMSGVLQNQRDFDVSQMSATASKMHNDEVNRKERHLRATEKIAAEKADHMGTKITRIPDVDRREIVGYENTIRNVDKLKTTIEGVAQSGKAPNLYTMRVNDAMKYLGAKDADLAVLKARNTNTLAQYIFSVSGKAVTEQEYARLSEVLVNDGDTIETALPKLASFREFMRERKHDALTGMKLAGYNVNPEFYQRDYDAGPVGRLAPKPGTIPGAVRR
jgi:hypothetical protein